MKSLKTLLQEVTAGIKAWANANFSLGTHVHGNVSNNGKLATASKALVTDSNKNITTSSVSDTELGYLSGVTSAIQTQLNAKAADSDVVHKTGNETIGGNKIFTGTNKVTDLLPVANGGALGNASLLHFNGFFEGVYVFDQIKVNGDRGAWIVPVWSDATSGIQILTADGIKPVQIGVATTDANNHIVLDTSKGYVNLYTGSTGTDNKVEFYPANTDISNLGTSTNKWKSFNGINPGALSLPSSHYVSIDTTGWDLTGATYNRVYINNANPTFPGILFIRINSSDPVSIIVKLFSTSGTEITYSGNKMEAANNNMIITVPCPPSTNIYVSIDTSSSINTCRYYTLLGDPEFDSRSGS